MVTFKKNAIKSFQIGHSTILENHLRQNIDYALFTTPNNQKSYKNSLIRYTNYFKSIQRYYRIFLEYMHYSIALQKNSISTSVSLILKGLGGNPNFLDCQKV